MGRNRRRCEVCPVDVLLCTLCTNLRDTHARSDDESEEESDSESESEEEADEAPVVVPVLIARIVDIFNSH